MKKLTITLTIAAISLLMVSCGNKTDNALSKLEKGVDKALSLSEKAKAGDTKALKKIVELAEECSKIEESLNKEEFTEEQKNRYEDIISKSYGVDVTALENAAETLEEATDF